MEVTVSNEIVMSIFGPSHEALAGYCLTGEVPGVPNIDGQL